MKAARWPALPRRCLVCQGWQASALCEPCLGRFAPMVRRCGRCAIRLAGPLAGRPAAPPGSTEDAEREASLASQPLCPRCRDAPPAFQRTVALADYAFPFSRLIPRLKYHAAPELAAALARPLAQRLAAQHARQADAAPEALVPMPLSPQRLAERGYNQALELSRALARPLDLPLWPEALARRHQERQQVGAGRAERLSQGLASFRPGPDAHRLPGRRIALVDDVMTTGGSADAAARQLLQAGAAEVEVWVIARTPDPGAA